MKKSVHILLAAALLMAATITGCDQNKSDDGSLGSLGKGNAQV